MTGRVGLVAVSHSARLADGVVELAAQMAPDVRLRAAGGMADGGLGTDFDLVSAALAEADDGSSGAVLLYDLGSARMIAELAVEAYADPTRVRVAEAPLVEGTVAAAVAAQSGSDLAAVVAAAEGRPVSSSEAEPAESVDIVLHNRVGLHARPAALLARSVAELDAEVTVHFGDREADARSVLALLGLSAGSGDTVTVSASGAEADEALRRVTDLAARDFDE